MDSVTGILWNLSSCEVSMLSLEGWLVIILLLLMIEICISEDTNRNACCSSTNLE